MGKFYLSNCTTPRTTCLTRYTMSSHLCPFFQKYSHTHQRVSATELARLPYLCIILCPTIEQNGNVEYLAKDFYGHPTNYYTNGVYLYRCYRVFPPFRVHSITFQFNSIHSFLFSFFFHICCCYCLFFHSLKS